MAAARRDLLLLTSDQSLVSVWTLEGLVAFNPSLSVRGDPPPLAAGADSAPRGPDSASSASPSTQTSSSGGDKSV